jgi:hypothetical protein
MIRSLFFFLTVLLFISCATPGRIIEISDPFSDIQGIKLTQNLIAQSAEDSNHASSRKSRSVSMIYLLEQKKNESPTLFLDVKIETAKPTDQLDSVMVIKLDNEEIRIAANEFKSNEFPKSNTGSNQILSSQFLVPENLWIPIVYSDEIQYHFYVGENVIDVKLTLEEISKLKNYFNRAIQLRDANFPPIPEGLKKW